MSQHSTFVHHVFFWLHQPADAPALIEGLKKMTGLPEIQFHHIGVPADTNRPVIDSSYQVSWLLHFASKEEQDVYQDHPIHHEFIRTCSHLWSKVLVYDSIQA